ncbi:MAG: tetratricopeptide repeat protein [Chloroflexota bacterium]|nr:MAG: tetratricopeptide repeat protein [Chloroflexota bacterium]
MSVLTRDATQTAATAVETTGWRLDVAARQVAVYATLAIFLAVPLIFTGITNDMFDLPKLVVLRLLTIVALLALVAVALAKGKVVLGRTMLDVPILAYLAVLVVTTIQSISPTNSLNGEYSRYDGLYTIVNYVLLYLLAAHALRRHVFTAVSVMALTALVIALEVFAEHLSVAAVLDTAKYFDGRPASFLGNPDFLGAYLTLATPIALGLFLASARRSARIVWAIVFVVLVAALALSFTRAAWLGFLAGLPIFLIEWRILAKRVFWLLAIVVALALSLALLGVLPLFPRAETVATQHTAPAAEPSRARSILERAASTRDISSGTAAVRLQIWESALPLVAENPILGTGPNTFRAVIDKHIIPAYAAGEGRDHDPDRAHNNYLQLAVTTGLLGLIAYLVVLGAFGLMMWRWLRREARPRARMLGVAILSAWFGYLAQDFFFFGVIGTASQWWLLMGLAVALSATASQRPRFALTVPGRAVFRLLVGIAAVVLAAYLAFGAVRLWLADYAIEQGQKLLLSQQDAPDPEVGLQKYREAIALVPDQPYYYEMYASALAILAIGGHSGSPDSGPQTRYLDETIRAMNSAVNLDPQFAALYLRRGAFYEMYGADHQLDALKDYRRVVSMYPYSYYGNQGLAEMARRLGLTSEAIGAQRTALVVVPDDRLGRIYLGLDYANAGRVAEAQKLLEELLSADPGDTEARFALGFAFEKQRQTERAFTEYRAVLEADPQHERARVGIARLENPDPTPAGHPPLGGMMSGY